MGERAQDTDINKLLKDAVQNPPVACGASNIVFNFADPAFGNYILRIHRGTLESLRKQLLNSSSLTPLHLNVSPERCFPINTGQAILEIRGKNCEALGSINIRQNGRCYDDYLSPNANKTIVYELPALEHFMADAAALPQSSYEALLKDLQQVVSHGYNFDWMGSNLLIDKPSERFKLVDLDPGSKPRTAAEVEDYDIPQIIGRHFSYLVGRHTRLFKDGKPSPELLKNAKTVFEKIFAAAEALHMPNKCLQVEHGMEHISDIYDYSIAEKSAFLQRARNVTSIPPVSLPLHQPPKISCAIASSDSARRLLDLLNQQSQHLISR